MFVDLVGSTELSASLDPEDFRYVIAAYHDCVGDVVAQHGGFVARYHGDGELIYFGYPRARENDAETAIRAGLQILDAVNRLDTSAGPAGTLRARIGIATGLTVVGDLALSRSLLTAEVVGDAANLAARLQTLAEPGTMIADDTTRRLAGGLFEYRQLDPVKLKGIRAPHRPWAVVGESEIESRFEALRAPHTTFVNREDEIDLLSRRWEQAKLGAGRAVVICGDPGMGKSRLVTALEHMLRDEPHERVRFYCSPNHAASPLYPVRRELSHAAGFERSDNGSNKFAKLQRLLLPYVRSDSEINAIADLLSIDVTLYRLNDELTPKRKREITLAALVRRLEMLARQNPLLVVVEDLHWADPTSLDMLLLLIQALDRLPILVIVTTRLDSQPDWSARPHVTTIVLSGLLRSDASELVRAIARGGRLGGEIVQRIVEGSDGVPLFLEELTRTAMEGASNDPWPGVVEPLAADSVPIKLQSLLMARLDRLTFGKEVALLGSVIGREFSLTTIAKLCQDSPERLANCLDELVKADLLLERVSQSDRAYAFKHALVHETAYSALTHERRRATHLRLAEMLEAESDDARMSEPEILAWHFAQGAAVEKAVGYYEKAAEQASGRYALAEKVNHLRRALEQIHKKTDPSHRELNLQLALGRSLIDWQGSGSEEVRTAFERARELCRILGDDQALLKVNDGLVNHYFTRSEPLKVLTLIDELLEVYGTLQDRQALLLARRSAGLANLLLGRFEIARTEMEAMLDIYDRVRDGPEAGLTTRDPKVSICTVLGMCRTALGDLRGGAAAADDGIRHAESLEHVVSLVLALRRACVQRIMQRDTRGTRDYAGRLLAVDADFQTFLGTREGLIFYSWAAYREQPDSSLLAKMHKALGELDAAQHWVMLPFFHGCVAELAGEQGEVDLASHLLHRASELIAQTGERWSEAELLRLKAKFCEADASRVEQLLKTSLAIAQNQHARLWELRSATTLAQHWRSQGREAEARQLLSPIFACFPDATYAPDLDAAKTLLQAIDKVRQT